MMTIALLIGLWSTSCIQTQISENNQGFAVESYEFSETGRYTFSRKWFSDPSCSKSIGEETEAGILKLGPKLSGVFISQDTFEANFKSSVDGKEDLGAIALSNDKSLKVARGLKGSTFRNTMLGIFEYLKQ